MLSYPSFTVYCFSLQSTLTELEEVAADIASQTEIQRSVYTDLGETPSEEFLEAVNQFDNLQGMLGFVFVYSGTRPSYLTNLLVEWPELGYM